MKKWFFIIFVIGTLTSCFNNKQKVDNPIPECMAQVLEKDSIVNSAIVQDKGIFLTAINPIAAMAFGKMEVSPKLDELNSSIITASTIDLHPEADIVWIPENPIFRYDGHIWNIPTDSRLYSIYKNIMNKEEEKKRRIQELENFKYSDENAATEFCKKYGTK